MAAILGKSNNKNVIIDVPRLLETRLLVQANSGGGKSWALRRLLEQTANQVQHIIIDSEGEFATLREKFDYIIAAPNDGDAVAHPRTAALLAKRILELRVSVIVDIYDLKAFERKQFVKLFFEAMINIPKKYWNPAIVVLDEAHIFAPEKGKAESTSAVIDIATRGRKRGWCLIPATQRLSKLHKDVAAECINKMIGRTGLDIDVKRATDELGMTQREGVNQLRNLQPGEFYCFGPALTAIVEKIKIGAVKTTHPKPGNRLLTAPPPASEKVKSMLAKLADLPQEAEKAAQSLADLKQENAQLKRENTVLKKQAGNGTKPTEGDIQRRIEEAVAVASKGGDDKVTKEYRKAIEKIGKVVSPLLVPMIVKHPGKVDLENLPLGNITHNPPGEVRFITSNGSNLGKGPTRILAELAARFPAGYTKSQVATLTKFSPKSGTYSNYLSKLRQSNFITDQDGLIFATETGIGHLGADIPSAPKTHDEIMAMWQRSLGKTPFQILGTIVAHGKQGITRNDIAYHVGLSERSGTFSNYLSTLRRNGLIRDKEGVFIATDILFPEGA